MKTRFPIALRMLGRAITPLAMLAVLLAARLPFAQDSAPASAPAVQAPERSTTSEDLRVSEILDQLRERYDQMKSVQGKFDQTRHSETFMEDTVSEGEFFHLKPDLFRCDYKTVSKETGKLAEDSSSLIVDNVAYLELPKLKQVEKYTFASKEELRQKMGLILLGVGVTPKELLDTYEVTWIEEESKDGVAAMRFVPRFEDNSGIKAVNVWIDRKSLEPKQLVIEESEDTTRVAIKEFQLNPKDVSSKLFEAKFPKDWTVIDKLD